MTSDDRLLPLRWGDRAMYKREGLGEVDPTTGVVPRVTLLWATPDPMGAMANMNEMYVGHVVRDMAMDLTDGMREQAWDDMLATRLQAPMEAVVFQFLIEGLDRSITHQMVRQRTAVYAQESLRFAVVDDLGKGTCLPPSLWGTLPPSLWRDVTKDDRFLYPDGPPEDSDRQRQREIWDDAISTISSAYQSLIDMGMPAEEARGLLPHATATRIIYQTNLRNLVEHAGNRLCTQAQFQWRFIFTGIVNAIRTYDRYGWQFRKIANSRLFRPVCYSTGKCEFMASADRACSIRDRVQAFHDNGVASSEWDYTYENREAGVNIPAIRSEEWLLDDSAARRK